MANEKRLIDANEMKNNIMEAMMRQFEKNGDQMALRIAEMLWHFVDATDTVDAVEVVRGRWLFDSNTERYFCSACNEQALSTSKDEPVYDYDWEENLRYSHTETIVEEHLTNYCPNCGAKMDGDGNG